MQAQTIHCPTCGASLKGDATRCAYCDTVLATVGCPSCFAMMFIGSRFCPHCGARAARQDDGAAALRCPRCAVFMSRVHLRETWVDECPDCAGLWIDGSTFEQICNDADTQAAAVELFNPKPRPWPVESNVKYVRCPQCDQMMNRANYAGRSGIILDFCRPHGAWFDREELRRIIEFIRGGGLMRAREIQMEELLRRREQLDNEQQIAASSGTFESTAATGIGTLDLLVRILQ